MDKLTPAQTLVTWDNEDRELRLILACVELFTKDGFETNDGRHTERQARVADYIAKRYGGLF